jgi:hypothetical protein
LPDVNSIRGSLVRLNQILQTGKDRSGSQFRKFGSEDGNVWFDLFDSVDNFVTNVLSFSITIGPNDEVSGESEKVRMID